MLKIDNMITQLENMEQGEKITVIGLGDLGFIQATQTRLHNIDIKKDKHSNIGQERIHLIHKPKHKRKYFRKDISNDIVILKGWFNIDTNKINFREYEQNGMTIKESYTTAFDRFPLKDFELLYEDEMVFSSIK